MHKIIHTCTYNYTKVLLGSYKHTEPIAMAEIVEKLLNELKETDFLTTSEWAEQESPMGL